MLTPTLVSLQGCRRQRASGWTTCAASASSGSASSRDGGPTTRARASRRRHAGSRSSCTGPCSSWTRCCRPCPLATTDPEVTSWAEGGQGRCADFLRVAWSAAGGCGSSRGGASLGLTDGLVFDVDFEDGFSLDASLPPRIQGWWGVGEFREDRRTEPIAFFIVFFFLSELWCSVICHASKSAVQRSAYFRLIRVCEPACRSCPLICASFGG